MSDSPFAPPPPRTSGLAVASLVAGFLSFCLSLLAGALGLLLGVLALWDIGRSQGRLRGAGLAWTGIGLSVLGTISTFAVVLLLLLLPAVQAAREAAREAARQAAVANDPATNLKKIGLAIHNYHDVYRALPYAGSDDPKLGIPLSWRVRILPFIEEGPLFAKFNFNEPWDSPTNKALIAQMPAVFEAPGVTLEEGRTVYLGVLGASKRLERPMSSPDRRTAFDNSQFVINFHDILDGVGNTVMIVEADPAEAAIWTQPDDWEYDPQAPRRGLGSLRDGGFTALFVGGQAAPVPNTVSDDDLRRLFLIQDGQPLGGFTPP